MAGVVLESGDAGPAEAGSATGPAGAGLAGGEVCFGVSVIGLFPSLKSFLQKHGLVGD